MLNLYTKNINMDILLQILKYCIYICRVNNFNNKLRQ